MNKITLRRGDICAIKEYMDDNPNINLIDVEYDDSSGIGYTLNISHDINHCGYNGKFKVEIVGTEDW